MQEMSKVSFSILITFFMFLESYCSEPNFIKKNGTLSIEENKKIYILADDAIDYEVFLSPDKRAFAVETLLMSNLQIIRIYTKNNNKFEPQNSPVSKKLWQDFSEEKKFKVEDISHPSMKFIKWINNNQLLVELSGDINNITVDANISYNLISSP
jgi:hypothetical protein